LAISNNQPNYRWNAKREILSERLKLAFERESRRENDYESRLDEYRSRQQPPAPAVWDGYLNTYSKLKCYTLLFEHLGKTVEIYGVHLKEQGLILEALQISPTPQDRKPLFDEWTFINADMAALADNELGLISDMYNIAAK
jgi:hypothetical protein